VFYGITIPFAVLGIIKKYKEDYLYLIYIFFTITLFIFWPGTQGLRFIFSILPFYIYFLFVGLSKISISEIIPAKYNPLNLNLAHIFCIVIILGSCVGIGYASYYYSIFDKSNVIEGPYTNESIEMFDYISTNTLNDDVIIFWKSRVMTLYTNRRCILVSEFDQIIDSDARYIVCNEEFEKHYNPLIYSIIQNRKETFKLVFQNNDYEVYEIMRKK
jgi:energy-coupling factor transporter transmembrane protein EcfT